ncbi:hypothetical protein [Pseudomonas sp. CF10PS3]
MNHPKYVPSQELIDKSTRSALANQATHLWGPITTDQVREKLKLPADLASFVDSFLTRKDAHKDLPKSSLDRNYLLAQAKLL